MSASREVQGRAETPPPEPDPTENYDSADSVSVSSSTSSSDSETSRDSTPKKKKKKRHHTFLNRMPSLGKEVALMVFMAVAYATLNTESPIKISKSPAAYPFFPKGSLVTDWYRGQITKAIEQARVSDVAFVMFYAPWDAASQNARKEFEKAAEYMQKYVTFTAVNCWQPGSECKGQYSKVYKWPVLIAYPTHGRGVQYSGPLDASHMIKFLQAVCSPLVSPQNVNDLISRRDAVVLANIDVLPGSYEYAVFYLAALRFLERDFSRDVEFAVVPQAKEATPNLHLYLWNETITYSGDWSTDSLSAWIFKNLHLISGWLSPTGSKSTSLSSYIQPGPALIMFTPRNPFSQQTDYYNLLKEVSFEYHNCGNNDVVTLKQQLIHMARLKNFLAHRELRRRCRRPDASLHPHHVVTTVPKIWTNSSATFAHDCSTCHRFAEASGCKDSPRHPPKAEPAPAAFADPRDPRSPENLRRDAGAAECLRFVSAEKYEPAIFARNITNEAFPPSVNISGLSCKTNRSLTLIAMDSLRYYHFAERLGVDLLGGEGGEDKTAVVIINDRLETHHVMRGGMSAENLRWFVKNFTEGSLVRALHSNAHLTSRNTHVHSDLSCDSDGSAPKFCVRELDSEDFLAAIMKSNKAVLVFYYSKQCAMCSGIAHTYLTVAKMLSTVDNVEFTRIDGDLNLLPWEYTMESYPTVLFFPPNRKSESRAFPRSIPVTVPNLMGFILTNLEPELKLEAMWAICNQTKFEMEKVKCISGVRAETLAVIGRTLRQWRSAGFRQKAQALHKLQMLRNLHLLFAHSPMKVTSIDQHLAKLNFATRRPLKDEL